MSERHDAASLFVHIFKTPLSSIKVASELLFKHLKDQLSNKDRELLDLIIRNSKTLEMRVDRLVAQMQTMNPGTDPSGSNDGLQLSMGREELEIIHALASEREAENIRSIEPPSQPVTEIPASAAAVSEIPIISLDEMAKDFQKPSPPASSSSPMQGECPSREKIVVRADPEIADLIPRFLENRHKDIVSISKALEKGDFESIRMLGHSMKGAGGGYGFSGVSEIGKSLEEAAKNKDAEKIRKGMVDLAMYLERLEVIYD